MSSFARFRLLASDLDGTLISATGGEDGAARRRFHAWRAGRKDIRLAYLTGRHFELATSGV